MTEYLLLGISLTLYSILHSVLADNFLLKKIYYLWWYRFVYVVLSIILLIPIYYIYFSIEDDYVFNPGLGVKIVLYLVDFLAIVFGYYASRSYNNAEFLGLKQLKDYFLKREKYVKLEKKLVINGALSYVRHPYYFVGLVLLWFRPLHYKDLVVNVVFTLYFIVGALNEERKLLKIFGNDYEVYRKRVPMLIPKIKIGR